MLLLVLLLLFKQNTSAGAQELRSITAVSIAKAPEPAETSKSKSTQASLKLTVSQVGLSVQVPECHSPGSSADSRPESSVARRRRPRPRRRPRSARRGHPTSQSANRASCCRSPISGEELGNNHELLPKDQDQFVFILISILDHFLEASSNLDLILISILIFS